MKLSEIDATEAPKHVMVYGPPKTGKTLSALTLAEHGYDIKYLGGENGHLVAKQLSLPAQERIDIIAFPDTWDNPCFMKGLYTLFKNGELNPCVEHGLNKCPMCTARQKSMNHIKLVEATAKTVYVLDSATQWGNSILATIGNKEGDDWKAEFDDWAKLGHILDMGLGYIQNSPHNWIVISHEVAHKTTDKKDEKIFPVAGTRNFSRNSAKYFDTVVYCEVVGGKHVFASRTTYKNNVLTGDRLGVQIESSDRGLLPIFEADRSGNKLVGNAAALAQLKSIKL